MKRDLQILYWSRLVCENAESQIPAIEKVIDRRIGDDAIDILATALSNFDDNAVKQLAADELKLVSSEKISDNLPSAVRSEIDKIKDEMVEKMNESSDDWSFLKLVAGTILVIGATIAAATIEVKPEKLIAAEVAKVQQLKDNGAAQEEIDAAMKKLSMLIHQKSTRTSKYRLGKNGQPQIKTGEKSSRAPLRKPGFGSTLNSKFTQQASYKDIF